MRIKFDDFILFYKDDEITKEKVFNRLFQWYLKHETFTGESIMQSDKPCMDAPVFLSELAEEVFEFKANWKS